MHTNEVPVERLLVRLEKDGLARHTTDGWALTDAGLRNVETLNKERA